MNFARKMLVSSLGISTAIALAAGCSSSTSGGSTNEDAGSTSSSSSSSSGGSSSGASSGSSSGSSSSSSSGGASSSSSGASSSSSSGAGDSGSEASAEAGGCSGATPVALTVKNVSSWCTLKVNGQTLTSAPADQTVCVASNSSVSLMAVANSGFILGPWHGTSGDHDGGDSSASTNVSVTTGSACVWICCPFTGGTGCPTTDQCP